MCLQWVAKFALDAGLSLSHNPQMGGLNSFRSVACIINITEKFGGKSIIFAPSLPQILLNFIFEWLNTFG